MTNRDEIYLHCTFTVTIAIVLLPTLPGAFTTVKWLTHKITNDD